jgi:short-subunit dehydrogenase
VSIEGKAGATTAVRKRALVTGASRGIGRAVAMRLSRDGYEIVAVARKAPELEALRAEIESGGGVCRSIVLDLTDAASIANALADVDVDVLVNNAGIGITKAFVDLTPDEWQQMIALNVNALFHVTRASIVGNTARGSGHVCTIGSISGRSAFVGGTCYAATKAFVTAWAESLLLEVRERGVKVSVIAPGGVATGFGGKAATAADDWKLKPEDVADAVSYVVGTPPSVLLHRVEVRTLNSPPKRG